MADKKALVWAIAIAVLSLAAAGGVGYFAWTQRGDYAEAKDQLGKVRWESESCAKELGQHKTSNTELTERAASCETARQDDDKERKAVEASLTKMEANLSATREELDDLRKRRAEIEKRVAEFGALTEQFEQMTAGKRVEVAERNGYMYISVPTAGLFDADSAELSKKGQFEFTEVAVILKNKRFAERRFMVVGHTDGQRVRSAKFANTWELSAARALTVIQLMIEAGMKPQNLLPAAQAQYDPIGGKPSHQIEIVLLPDSSETPPLPADAKTTTKTAGETVDEPAVGPKQP